MISENEFIHKFMHEFVDFLYCENVNLCINLVSFNMSLS